MAGSKTARKNQVGKGEALTWWQALGLKRMLWMNGKGKKVLVWVNEKGERVNG